jgi:hypothetical protein
VARSEEMFESALSLPFSVSPGPLTGRQQSVHCGTRHEGTIAVVTDSDEHRLAPLETLSLQVDEHDMTLETLSTGRFDVHDCEDVGRGTAYSWLLTRDEQAAR